MKDNQSGRSMLEMLCVLGVMAVLSVGALNGYQYMITRYNANRTVALITEISNNLKSAYGEQETYEGLDNETAMSIGAFPGELGNNPQKTMNPHGGGLINVFTSNKLDTDCISDENVEDGCQTAAVVELGGISRDTCLALATADWGRSPDLIAVVVSSENGGATANTGAPITKAGGSGTNNTGADNVYAGEDEAYSASKYSKFGYGVVGNTKKHEIPMRVNVATQGCRCVDENEIDTGQCSFAMKFY